MDKLINIQILQRIVIPLLIILTSLLIGWFIEKRIIGKLKRLTQKTGWKFGETIILSTRGMSLLWFLLGGIALTLPTLPLNHTAIIVTQKILLAIFLASATFIAAKLSVGLLRFYTSKDEGISPLTSLFEFLIRVFVFSIGILIILQSIGIEITPLLTAFGVGGVSLGLALQNTLANLMSGINIITSRKLKPGDYIQLKTGESGYVADVELKYTIIREITANFLVIPNSKILSSSFRNYSLPEKEMLVPIELGISYDSDLEKVEAITLEVAQQTLREVPGGVPEYEPFIYYNEFDYYSINFTVYLKVREQAYFEHLNIKHQFIKRLHKRYATEKIKIPFPLQSAFVSHFPHKKVASAIKADNSENVRKGRPDNLNQDEISLD